MIKTGAVRKSRAGNSHDGGLPRLYKIHKLWAFAGKWGYNDKMKHINTYTAHIKYTVLLWWV